MSLDAWGKSAPAGQSHKCDRGSRGKARSRPAVSCQSVPGPEPGPRAEMTVRAGRAAEAQRGPGPAGAESGARRGGVRGPQGRGPGPAGAGPRSHRPLGLGEHGCEWLSCAGPTPPLAAGRCRQPRAAERAVGTAGATLPRKWPPLELERVKNVATLSPDAPPCRVRRLAGAVAGTLGRALGQKEQVNARAPWGSTKRLPDAHGRHRRLI